MFKSYAMFIWILLAVLTSVSAVPLNHAPHTRYDSLHIILTPSKPVMDLPLTAS